MAAKLVTSGRKKTSSKKDVSLKETSFAVSSKTCTDRYCNLFQSSQDAIMTLEPPTWNFTSGNPAALKLFGVKTEKEFLVLHPNDLSPERQPDNQLSSTKSKKLITQALQDGRVFFEWTHKKYRGQNFSATVLLSRVKEGTNVFLQATVRDITGNQKIDDDLKEKIEELERLNKLMIGRELKMVELKNTIEKLKSK